MKISDKTHSLEVSSGERFDFGDNWSQFVKLLDEQRINQAVNSLATMLRVDDLKGKTFLDIGCGSGLFSLAAKRLGAQVYSFDYDPKSVACTTALKEKYSDIDGEWTVELGSVLDPIYLSSIGKFDVVYSWGVLHHTGNMWAALNNVTIPLADTGKLFIALYNDQGGASKRWLKVKIIYNKLPKPLNNIFAVMVYMPLEIRSFFIYLLRGKPLAYFNYIKNYKIERGMSWWHDKIDWIGGYPFEVSKPEDIFRFYRNKNYTLCELKTCAGSLGCNEYVFLRNG